MEKYEKYSYYKPMEEITDSIIARTSNTDRSFYRNLINFHIGICASSMRAVVKSEAIGAIPINFYAVSLASSGYSKGFSSNIVIKEVMSGFRDRFVEETLPFIADYWIDKLAHSIASKNSTDFDLELEELQKEYTNLGDFMFEFDSGTLAGIRQLRQKVLMTKIGALSFIVDEIGSNITDSGVFDIMTAFLELYDMGNLIPKVLLNSTERKRLRSLKGWTAANMLLFGTPSKLFDAGLAEKRFKELLTTGMSRRCFYAYSIESKKNFDITPEEIYAKLTDKSKKAVLSGYWDSFKDLADSSNYDTTIKMGKQASILLIAYRQDCEKLAYEYSDIEIEKKAELSHSYFKVMKLAGSYAFADGLSEVSEYHLGAAIRCGLDSTKVFQTRIIKQPQPHLRLLNYLCGVGVPCTYADMTRDLPFFPKGIGARNEILILAASEGYINNITLKHTVDNNIDLYSACELEKTSLDKITLAYSDKISRDYENIEIEFQQIHKLTQAEGYHWTNHHLEDGKRSEANAYSGFNIIVLDLDYGVDIDTVKLVLADYTYHIYTTKRHSKEEQRFRAVIPISHIVKLGTKEFGKFMRNVFEWLPFDVDEQTNQRSRKWLSNEGEYYYNEGNLLLDAHQFIPHTTKAIALNNTNAEYSNSPQLEKWFIRSVQDGSGRNNTLARYAFLLVDTDLDYLSIMDKVLAMNSKLPQPIPESRIYSTIGVTTANKIAERDLSSKESH